MIDSKGHPCECNTEAHGEPRVGGGSESTVYTWGDIRASIDAGIGGPPIYLDVIRHAESIANAKGLIAGRSEWDLSVKGHLQALALGRKLQSRYDYAWVSELHRTQKTLAWAKLLWYVLPPNPSKGPPPPACRDWRLDERSFGELEGKPRRSIEAYTKGDLEYAPANGESYVELTRRLLSFLIDLRTTIQRESHVVILTHIGPMRVLAALLAGISDPKQVLQLSFPNAEPQRFILRALEWPSFIRPIGVGCERCRVQLGYSNSASRNREV